MFAFWQMLEAAAAAANGKVLWERPSSSSHMINAVCCSYPLYFGHDGQLSLVRLSSVSVKSEQMNTQLDRQSSWRWHCRLDNYASVFEKRRHLNEKDEKKKKKKLLRSDNAKDSCLYSIFHQFAYLTFNHSNITLITSYC